MSVPTRGPFRLASLTVGNGGTPIHPWRQEVRGGWRRSASYVDRIFKGANPVEMPFEQIDRFELVVNLKTARALGLTIPPTILLRADEVIE